ncbi:MAG: cytochrome b [Lysobacteraceae bacterium]
MPWRSTDDNWGHLTRLLHWGIALAIIALAVIGLYMEAMPNSMAKLKVYALHKSLGLTVLALALVRLLWRLFDRRPAYPAAMPGWQRQLSGFTHGLLYVLMFAMPLSGWLYNSASNFPLRWFNLFRVPALSGPDPELKSLALLIHQAGFYLLAALVAVHVGAALYHHFVQRDATLARMLPGLSVPKEPR